MKDVIDVEYKNKTPEEKEFIKEAMMRYGDRYTYHNLTLKSRRDKVTITCPVHGDFEVKASYFLKDKWCIGCIECYREDHFQKFLEKLKIIHPEYSVIPGKTKYITTNVPIWLHCGIHNVDFKARPDNLLAGKTGCRQCYLGNRTETRRKSKEEEFKKKIETTFPGQFDFSKYKYINNTENITLICRDCGKEFQISPALAINYIKHSEKICPTERKEEVELRYFLKFYNLEENVLDETKKLYPGHTLLDYIFIYKSTLVWKDYFDYSRVNYVNQSTPVELIIKSSRKSYFQLPGNNLKGRNPSRSCSGGEALVEMWLDDNNLTYIYRDLLKDHPIEGRTPGSTVEIDFTLEMGDKIVWIEYNGEQHYRRSPKFCPTEEEYLGQLRRDENIREYTKTHDILFIEIPWTYNKYEDIDDLLTRIILQGESPDIIIQPKIERI